MPEASKIMSTERKETGAAWSELSESGGCLWGGVWEWVRTGRKTPAAVRRRAERNERGFPRVRMD